MRSHVRTATGIAFAGLMAAAAASAAEAGETMDVYVRCTVDGPMDRTADFGVEGHYYGTPRFVSQPTRMKVLRDEYERAFSKIQMEPWVRPWHEEHYAQWALEKAYQASYTELVGLPFVKFVWRGAVEERPASKSAPGEWRPGELGCSAEVDPSKFEPVLYEPLRRSYLIQTDWSLAEPLLLDGVEFEVAAPAPDIRSQSGGIVIEDRTPIGPSPETRAQALAEQRRVAGNLAKAKAEAAQADARTRAQLARMLEEARKRCPPSTAGQKGACAQ